MANELGDIDQSRRRIRIRLANELGDIALRLEPPITHEMFRGKDLINLETPKWKVIQFAYPSRLERGIE